MAMADCITNASAAEWALVRKHSSEDIFGVQICGNNPYVLSKCGQLLEDTTEIDFIDLDVIFYISYIPLHFMNSNSTFYIAFSLAAPLILYMKKEPGVDL